jgi:3-keto-disaccharide hydrolase
MTGLTLPEDNPRFQEHSAMRLRSRLAALAVVPLFVWAAYAADSPEVPAFAKELPRVRSGEPIFAFNGKDLSGFYAYTKKNKYRDPQQVFTVQDGMIRASGEDFGGLATGGNFSNYHLIVEWKWGDETFAPRKDKARDSGILLHCVGPDGAAGGQWMESIECQIIEGGCGDFILVGGKGKPTMSCEVRKDGNQLYYEKGGEVVTRNSARYNWWGRDPAWKDQLGFRGSRDVESPAGQWNRMEVICDGDSITNIVNGYLVNVGTKSSLTEGKIQLQSEGAEIFFRKVEVRPLVK